MLRAEMVRAVQNAINDCNKGYFSREDASYVLDAVLENVIVKGLMSEGKLNLRGIGTFEVHDHAGRSIPSLVSPGNIQEIPPYRAVSFKASGILKDKINGRVDD